MSLPERLVIVDVETTGPRVTRDRVIEVGIMRIEHGQLVKTYSSLINPQAYVSPFIENYTGITKDQLVTAPTFEQVAHELSEIMQDCVFVAHNVRFDYGFLKNEFRRFGISFAPKHFCTVKLSRQLFPHHKRHGLDAIIERFEIACPNRHRALDDAQVLWDFLQRIESMFDSETLATHLKRALKQPSLPSQMAPGTIENLPDSPGVYIFYGEEGYPLYVGKSKSIRERVLSHFLADHTSSKEMHLSQQVYSIETIETAGELSALIKEAQLVKELQPLYNRKLRHARKLVLVKKTTTAEGYDTVSYDSTDTICVDDVPHILGVYKSLKQAKEAMESHAKTFGLCQKLLGLEKSMGPCFGRQLGWCSGACAGEELAIKYNLRIMHAFARTKFKTWPFSGPILFHEENDPNQALIIDKWCVIGVANENTHELTLSPQDYAFDLDTYKILQQFLLSPKYQKYIKPFVHQPTLQFV